jgi:hypothetical protein
MNKIQSSAAITSLARQKVRITLNLIQRSDGSMVHIFDPPQAHISAGPADLTYRLVVTKDRPNDDKIELFQVYCCDPYHQLHRVCCQADKLTMSHHNQVRCLINLGIMVHNKTTGSTHYCDPEIINDPANLPTECEPE